MRIVIAIKKNDVLANTYCNNIFLLLKKIAADQFHEIIETSNFILSEKSLPENLFLFILIEKEKPSLLKLFDDIRFSLMVKKIKAELIINLSAISFKTLKVQQLLVLQDTFHLKKPEQKIIKKNFQSIFILTKTNNEKNFIQKKFSFDEKKIKLIYPSVTDIFQPISFSQRSLIQQKYAEGKEFFSVYLSNGEENLISILKSFSIFKKWQQSKMKLLIIDLFKNSNQDFIKRLEQYKYRKDVQIISVSDKKDHALLLASSYALLHFPKNNNDIILPAKSLQCGIPVICRNNENMQEICGDGALYSENDLPETIGKQMNILYKDEIFRNKMIVEISNNRERFSIKKNAMEFWNFMKVMVDVK